jgi:curli production assembly/transport component CsgG
VAVQGGVFKFVALDKILEAEAGITKNEPDQLAVQQAIEKAVYTIIVEGAEQGIWSFANKAAQNDLIGAHKAGSSLRRASAKSATDGKGSEEKQVATAALPEMARTTVVDLPVRAPERSRMVASAGKASQDSWATSVVERRPVATAVGLTVFESYEHLTTKK